MEEGLVFDVMDTEAAAPAAIAAAITTTSATSITYKSCSSACVSILHACRSRASHVSHSHSKAEASGSTTAGLTMLVSPANAHHPGASPTWCQVCRETPAAQQVRWCKRAALTRLVGRFACLVSKCIPLTTAAGAWGACATPACTGEIKAACPFDTSTALTAAVDGAAVMAGWLVPACLEAMCEARDDLAGSCSADAPGDLAAVRSSYAKLQGSAWVKQQLVATYNACRSRAVGDGAPQMVEGAMHGGARRPASGCVAEARLPCLSRLTTSAPVLPRSLFGSVL